MHFESHVEDVVMEEEKKEGEQQQDEEQVGIISYILWRNPIMKTGWSILSGVWNSIVWIKDLFFANEDGSGLISGHEFRQEFMSRVEEHGI